jgi:polynucleotide 5'-kinase involved in rRNA processing
VISKGVFSGLLEEKEDNEQDCLNVLPLLVNTDGFVRYMGAEVLQSVLEIVQPNNVLYIRSVKGTTVLPFDFLTQHTHCILSTLESPNDTPMISSSSSAAPSFSFFN